MRRFSPQWFDALRTKRFSREWPGVSGPAAPVMPWVTPPLHPYIRNLFSTWGVVREFGPGEWLFPRVQVRSFMYVEEGLTGRILASLDGQPGAGAMALSPPMRNASGNLNWVTGRAAIGRYQALSHVRVREIRHSDMHDILKPWINQDIFLLVMGQAELINLSDRMGFAILALLPAMERLKALFLCWARPYPRRERAAHCPLSRARPESPYCSGHPHFARDARQPSRGTARGSRLRARRRLLPARGFSASERARLDASCGRRRRLHRAPEAGRGHALCRGRGRRARIAHSSARMRNAKKAPYPERDRSFFDAFSNLSKPL